jgi:site-specific recombinase XerD
METTYQSESRFPWYVKEIFRNRKLNTNTIKGYILDIQVFFEWLINEEFCRAPIEKISLCVYHCCLNRRMP